MIKAVALVLLWLGSALAIQFTGDAGADFSDSTVDPATGRPRNAFVIKVVDSIGNDADGAPISGPDVGVPQQLGNVISGWDVENLWFHYSKDTDTLSIGIECFGICGDADGDGVDGRASAGLTSLGGQDLPDFARGEGIALALDFNLDVADVLPAAMGQSPVTPFDVLIGIPAGEPAGATDQLVCARGQTENNLYNGANCFGVHQYQRTTEVNLSRRFESRMQRQGAPWPATNHNPQPSLGAPDLEWSIEYLSELRALASASGDILRGEPFTILGQLFAGSFLDAGVGEDYVPSQNDFFELQFPCLAVDECDICLGDGSTCSDCAGVPAGPNVYDACDVCGGDDSSCVDCAGVPNGTTAYDVCDVCGGDGLGCVDCMGVAGGSARYDLCDVCAGNNASCADCKGVPRGLAEYDACDVCDGDGTSCCGPATGRECCVNYCMVPDAYWDFILLPKTIDNLIEKFAFTRDVFKWMCDNLPSYELIEGSELSMQTGRMAEFTRLFLEECLEPFCESSATIYSQLVFDNAVVGNQAIPTYERTLHKYGPKSHLNGPLGAK